MTLRKKITGQLAACYATVNRQLLSIQAENPVPLQQHVLSMLGVCISTETRFQFLFLKLYFQSLNATPRSYIIFQTKDGILRERFTLT